MQIQQHRLGNHHVDQAEQAELLHSVLGEAPYSVPSCAGTGS